MTQIPTPEENPKGLHQRYNITKHDGTPIDPNGIYFVLRLDFNGNDLAHIKACRAASLKYVQYIHTGLKLDHPLQQVADELFDLLKETE
jgi:hypothetical protein